MCEDDGMMYLQAAEILPYLEDGGRAALGSSNPIEQLRDYFRRVLAMDHVAGREYAYVVGTKWNRRSFVVVFHRQIRDLLKTEVTLADFYQLLLLLCPDFPKNQLDAVISAEMTVRSFCDIFFFLIFLFSGFRIFFF